MINEEQIKAQQFERDYPEHCADFKVYMGRLVNQMIGEIRNDTERFKKDIGL